MMGSIVRWKHVTPFDHSNTDFLKLLLLAAFLKSGEKLFFVTFGHPMAFALQMELAKDTNCAILLMIVSILGSG